MGPLKDLFALLCGLLLCVFFLAAPLAQAETPLGTEVTNIAQFSYSIENGTISVDTNAASFQVVARSTPSTIQFFRFAPNAPDAVAVQLNGSDYSPDGSGEAASFQPIGPPITLGGREIDASAPVPLIPADTYFSGELMIVRVEDAGQNGEPDRVETLVITIAADNGDHVTLRLYESGPDTGLFYAWIPSTPETTPGNDRMLTAPKNTELTARYVDRFDATEVSVDTALVDPFGRLFDSLTGELINGAEVTIVEAASGQPAAVFGIDGISAYPSTLITGGSVTDAGGNVYDLAPGEFLFPLMAPGQYRLLITPPQGYSFPSGVPADQFAALPNAPFEIIEGSYGAAFSVLATGPLNFDVPLDTNRSLTVSKHAGLAEAAVGDFVSYTVTIQNSEPASLPLIVRDLLPRGFRYVDNSVRLSSGGDVSASLSADGSVVTFEAGRIAAGASERLTYVLAIGPGTPNGEAVNNAMAMSPAGQPLSNRAEAAIRVREDLLRSRATLIGRVVENACDGEADWARQIQHGEGVEGVRLYLETGEYIVTDEDGQFHFEDIEPGTHVVQLDTETLPLGYEPMMCEDNSRYAGSATSKFVDVRGGVIWRANFYLKRTSAAADAEAAGPASSTTEYLGYDLAWLERTETQTAWAYPDAEQTPFQQSVNIGITAPDSSRVELFLNGRPVPDLNLQQRISRADRSLSLFRWRGVDINTGGNAFEAVITHADGREERIARDIWFVAEPQRAVLVDDQSVLVADGRRNPVVAIRLEDAAGRPVHAGRIVDVDVETPYRLKNTSDLEAATPLARTEIEAVGVEVGGDGIAYVELEPTLDAGRVRLTVPLRDGRLAEISAYLQPEERDWILVGLAEGELGYLDSDLPSLEAGEDFYQDGRIALFAKGMVRGDWLLTLAIDTAKRRGARDDILFDEIDPNAYYTLYGDRTRQANDAPSRYPLFVRLERGTAQVLFGDFDTDLADTELSEYRRRLSGLRAVHEGERISATGFVAETNQGFVKDELAADGTSGPYRLSTRPIVRSSEIVILETRDQVRPDIVLSSRTLTRYVDYEIDYPTGEIIFRAPVDATDGAFNPRVIVVDYETFADGDRSLTYGGRVAVRGLRGRAEIGLTHVHEAGVGQDAGQETDLTGIDLRVQITETTEAHAEYATSTRRPGEEGREEDVGDAWLMEVIHQGERVTLGAYVRQEDGEFGLGHTGSATEGIRRYGVTGSAVIDESVNPETGARRVRSLQANAYREELVDGDAERTVGELSVLQAGVLSSGSLGLRSVTENAGGEPRQSVSAIVSASQVFPELGLTVIGAHEQPLMDENGDEVSLFPQRTLIGVDKRITDRATLNLRHEMTNGANASGANSTAGVTLVPWTGGRMIGTLGQVTEDNASRLSATVGLDQSFQIDEAWSASIGAANRSRISGGDAPRDPFADAAVSPLAEGVRSSLTLDEGFTSAYGGIGYRSLTAAGSARVEYRDTASSQRHALIVAGARELTEEFSYAGTARYQSEISDISPERRSLEARLGAAWRPDGEGLVVLNRLDLVHNETLGEAQTWKIVNNLGLNMMVTERTQLAGFFGVKYVDTELAGVQVNGMTGLVGGEVRHDITSRIDLGLHAMMMTSEGSDTSEFAIGPSIGFSPMDDVWMSVGYNVVGFRDSDFEAAEFTDQGVFVRFRMKFDADDVGDVLDWISPH